MVYVDNRLDNESVECEQYYDCIEKVAKEALKQQNANTDAEISVSIVEPHEIQSLNNQYRNKNSITDVLSFPLFQPSEIENMKKQPVALGDIVICYEKAIEQAQQYEHGVAREIAFLTAHSMLHILGFDHETDEEEKEMIVLQEKILVQAGFPRK